MYNTQKKPIILKDYGRYMQELIQKIAEIPDQQTQTDCITALIPVLQNLSVKKGKSNRETPQLWSDAFIASDYQLNIETSHPLPNKEPIQPVEQKKIDKKEAANRFKCCGQNFTKLVQLLLKDIEQNPEAQEVITYLTKIIQQTHKKTKSMALNHLEHLAQKKITITHEEPENNIQPA